VSTSPSAALWDGAWIAIPAYNEEATIRAIAEAALALCPRVMVIDDGSVDATVALLEGLPLTMLRHVANQGKAASLRTAFRHALLHGARCVVTLDGDGQHDAADGASLLAAWHEHARCIVIGARLHDRARIPRSRYLGNRFACFWISWAAGHAIADSQSGCRVYPSAVMAIALGDRVRGDRFTFESEVLIEAARHGHPTHAVMIPARYPAGARASHYRSWLDTAKIVVMVGGRLLATGMNPRGLWRSVAPAVTALRIKASAAGARRAADRRPMSTE
jgi:glycosyltransferase involved in cell wall biosynthesis